MTEIYPVKTITVTPDGCGDNDDIDLDVPEFPVLASAAELDFSNCVQAQWYVNGVNGTVLSTAAAPDATYDECVQAIPQ